MAFKNYRKETSERSDEANWAKKILIEKTGLFFDSIEGCNENKDRHCPKFCVNGNRIQL